MKLYSQLSKVIFLKNRYVAKFLFVAFLGIHIPLLGLVYFVVYHEQRLSPLNVFLIALLLTIVASAVTLLVLKKLMEPVLRGSKALRDYRLNRTVPRLPLVYNDEAGVMLQNIQSTIQLNQKLLTEKKELFQMLTNDLRSQTQQTSEIIKNIFNGTDKEDIKEMATSAVKSMDQQLNYVEAFIEIQREETLLNAEKVVVRKVNVENVLNEVKRNFKSKLEAKNINLTFDIHVQEVRLKVSSKSLQKALSYLLANAIKFSSDSSEVNVKVERSQGRLMIYFKDDGMGFESDQADHIFKKFNTVTESSEEYAPGIGLYITRQILERFGGTIIAESAGKNQGATFSIEMKLYRSSL
ncbi:sensor histidine kinase [Flavobacterium sp. SM2513]|uniref:sensor histidine kinase n=1 Tax=Flavobacterium sp. SM2513 TaxID=3424766 RepID=UPI003D7FD1AE